jgi:hypothetical protein
MKESDIQKQISDFLKLKGWVPFKRSAGEQLKNRIE